MAYYPLKHDLELYRGDSFSQVIIKYWALNDATLQSLAGARGRAAFRDGKDSAGNDVWRAFTVLFTETTGPVTYTKPDGTAVDLGTQTYWSITLDMAASVTENIGVKQADWELDIEFADGTRRTVYKGKVKIGGEVIKKDAVPWSAPAA